MKNMNGGRAGKPKPEDPGPVCDDHILRYPFPQFHMLAQKKEHTHATHFSKAPACSKSASLQTPASSVLSS